MSSPIFHTFADQKSFIQQTASAIESAIIDAQKTRGEAHMALSGGSSPIPIYQALAGSDQINWAQLTLWLVDERHVPANNPESNQRMIRESFGKRIDQLKAFHHFDTTLNPDQSAQKYEAELRQKAEPLFDIVLLGLGEDGHTASLFPSTAELHESKRLVVPSWAQGYATPQRLTMTFPALLNSRQILFIIKGQNKKPVLDQLLKLASAQDDLPASFVLKHPNVSFYYSKQA